MTTTTSASPSASSTTSSSSSSSGGSLLPPRSAMCCPPDFVPPRPAEREVWLRRPKLSPLKALEKDRLHMQELSKFPKRVTSGGSIEAYVCNRKPYQDPELYSYGVLPPMSNPAKNRGPKIHVIDATDVVHPNSLSSQEEAKAQQEKGWDSRTALKPSPSSSSFPRIRGGRVVVGAWDSTTKRLDTGMWRPSERHRSY